MIKRGVLLAMVAVIILGTFSIVSCGDDDEPFCLVELQKGTLSDGISLGWKDATASFTIKSNTSWRVVNKPNFVNLDQMSGKGNATINVAYAPYMSSSDCDDYIVVQGDNTEAVSIRVRLLSY